MLKREISDALQAYKPYDYTTGLYYYGARYYDPGIDRFITEDGVAYSTTTNTLTLDRYVYALNNPETNSDPSGHFIDFWDRGYSNPEGPMTSSPPTPLTVTLPYLSPQSEEGNYRWGNMIRNTNYRVTHLGASMPRAPPRKSLGDGPQQSKTESSTKSSKLDFVHWFLQDFLPNHRSELAIDVVAIGLSALGPAAAIFLSSAGASFYSIKAILATLDYVGFINDLSSRDYTGAAVALGNVAFDVISTLWSHLSEPEMIEFAFAEGAWDVGTLGIGDVVDLGAVITASTVIGISFGAEVGLDFTQYIAG